MIPINLKVARNAFINKTINTWELTFLEGVHKEDSLTEKQYDKIIAIAEKILPDKLLVVKESTYRAPVDPYYNDSYFKDQY